ncbi:MAG: hypothetical protein FWE45_03085 [Firmicutes bacterium]|nr:hypothetical protein [Bacillota bacterium]
MTKKTKCVLSANALTMFAGIHGIISETGLTATGIGLFNIASSTTINTLAAENIISTNTKKKLATFVLVANMLPATMGIATIINSEASTSAGLGQIALGVASSVQCLDAMGKFKLKED